MLVCFLCGCRIVEGDQHQVEGPVDAQGNVAKTCFVKDAVEHHTPKDLIKSRKAMLAQKDVTIPARMFDLTHVAGEDSPRGRWQAVIPEVSE